MLAGTAAIIRPTFGQVQLVAQQAVKLVYRIAQVHRHHAVVRLASGTTPLALDAGRLVPLLRTGGLVDQADGPWTGAVARHQPLQGVDELLLVPGQRIEKLLQGPRRNVGGQGDRLDTLAVQVRQLPLDEGLQVSARLTAGKTIAKLLEVFPQLGLQLTNLRGVHA